MIQALLYLCLLIPQQAGQPTQPTLSPDAAASLQSGLDAENRNDLDQAIAAFRKAADLAPSSNDILLHLGDAYMKKHDYAGAIAPLKRAVELNPDSLQAHQLLGYALLAEGYASQAIPHLKMVQADGALGIAELQAGQPAEAVANLQAALTKSPDDPNLLFYLSRAYSALSEESSDKLLATSPDSARAHQVRGQADYGLKIFPNAEKEYQRAIALRPDLPGLRLELGRVFAAESEWEKAAEQFRAEAKLQPGNAEAAYRLGDALLQLGKMKEAEAELQRSDSLRPDMPETLYALGRAAAANDPNVAEHAFTRVIELEKGTSLAAQAYLALAGVHRRQGKPEQAAHDLQEYRRIQDLAAHPHD
ncbi:MAG: tetratricopeptide repeat protein [Candidatus Acidiferrales bacterium]